jgi:hypothetical protein
MSYTEEQYDTFAKHMEEKYPEMYENPYGGFCTGPGWWPIIDSLSGQISSYVKWRNRTREDLLKDNPYDHPIPEYIEPVRVAQIKEKFGGLRFYYDGGDEHISGMVRMAESWASNVCEECGNPGKSRSGGWIKTLCDHHDSERQAKYKERFSNAVDL